MEQTTDLEEENNNEIPQETHSDEVNSSRNTQKDKDTTPEERTPKTPENSQSTPLQEEPINTRGEKYNLQPNPNPNYSDSYRY